MIKNSVRISENFRVISCYRVKFSVVIFFLITIFLVFQNKISICFSAFQYFDEALALGIFIMGFANGIYRRTLKKSDLFMSILLFFFILIGGVSSCFYGYQNVWISVFGCFLHIKFFMLMLGTKWLLPNRYFSKEYLYNIKKIAIFEIWILILLNIYALCFQGDLFLEPWDVCAKTVFLISCIVIGENNTCVDFVTVMMGLSLLGITGKAKAYGAIVLFLLVYFWVIFFHRKIHIREIIFFGALIVLAAWEKIHFYYVIGVNKFARSVLTITSIKIANDYFPLGTGFSTYASYGAKEYYSPIYFLYGISNHPELGINRRSFLMDTYWPAVIAETGWIGLLCILGCVLMIFFQIQILYKKKEDLLYSMGMFTIGYILITTFEETGFMQPVLICLAILLGVCLKKSDQENNYSINQVMRKCEREYER